MSRPPLSVRDGFTLIELLVVIAILALTTMLLVGGITRSIARAQTVQCLSNIRQVGIASRLYSMEMGGRLPDISHLRDAEGNSRSWSITLRDFLGEGFLGRCPANRNSRATVSYAWNDMLTDPSGQGLRLHDVRHPSRTLKLGEHADGYLSEHFHFRGRSGEARLSLNQFRNQVGVERHGNSANYLFVDGHVATIPVSLVESRLRDPGIPFLNP